MALIDAARGRAWHETPITNRASALDKPQPKWQRAMLEVAVTSLVLIGLAPAF